MNTLQETFLIAGMALVTFSIRYVMIALSGRMTLSPRALQALRFVPPVVLTAIVVPAVLIPSGEILELSYTNARLIGAIAAFGIGWYTRNLLLTIVVGMVAFWLWQWGLTQLG